MLTLTGLGDHDGAKASCDGVAYLQLIMTLGACPLGLMTPKSLKTLVLNSDSNCFVANGHFAIA
jgi:hypothetical protein